MTLRALSRRGFFDVSEELGPPDVSIAFAIDASYLPLFKVALRSLALSLMSRGMGARGRRALSYGSIARDWAAEFGSHSLIVRRYRESLETTWDIIEDFATTLNETWADARKPKIAKNKSLTPIEAAYLRRLNAFARTHKIKRNGSLRNSFLDELKNRHQSVVIARLSQARARAFYDSFAEENELLRTVSFSAGEGVFSEDFSMYPMKTFDLDRLVVPEQLFRVMKKLNISLGS